MAMAIATHMEEHPDHVDISCDARNAFNTWCRSRLWGPLLEKFPSMFALVKLMYGDDADVIFYEDGAGIERIINAVGSRQGCSLGSFLYCLAIHPYLQQLRAEFPGLLILAYCDVHILGPPSRAIAAYKRWAEIYCNELQGELRDDKGVAFAPQHTKLDLIEQGMPDDMQHTSLGTRILGAPVGSEAFWVEYASTIVDEIARDFNVLGRVRNFQAQHIIASKSLVHRINHLLRNVPGGESTFHEIAARYDSCALSVVRRISALLSCQMWAAASPTYLLAWGVLDSAPGLVLLTLLSLPPTPTRPKLSPCYSQPTLISVTASRQPRLSSTFYPPRPIAPRRWPPPDSLSLPVARSPDSTSVLRACTKPCGHATTGRPVTSNTALPD